VLVARFGQFSHLWIEMCQLLGLDVEVVECDWGTVVPLEAFSEILSADKNHKIKAVLATQNETATGVQSDTAGLRRSMEAAERAVGAWQNDVKQDTRMRLAQ
jgi:alanine-glyoxylate transaminase/serine-glyoxylate transaminase/serine-pyruvate transaminase